MLDFSASCWPPKFLEFATDQKKYTKDVISLRVIGHRTSVLNVWVQIPLRLNSLGHWINNPLHGNQSKGSKRYLIGIKCQEKMTQISLSPNSRIARPAPNGIFSQMYLNPGPELLISIPTSLFQTMAGFGSPWPWQTSASSSPLLIL